MIRAMPIKSCARLQVVALVLGWMRQSIHRQSPRATTFTYRFHLVRRRWAVDMATFHRMAAAGANDPHQRESDECVKNSFFGDALASVRTVFRARRSSCQRKTEAVQTGISSFGNPESPQGRVRLLEDPGAHGPKSACPGSVGTCEAADVPGNRSWALREREESFICRFACPDGSPRRGLQVFGF